MIILTLLLIDLLNSSSQHNQLTITAIARSYRYPKPIYIHTYVSSPLLKKHFIVVWQDEHEARMIPLDFLNKRYVTGIGLDTSTYYLSARNLKNEFNKMIRQESLFLNSSDDAIELAKLFISCMMLWERTTWWGFNEDFDSYYSKYKDNYTYFFEEYPFIKTLGTPGVFFSESLRYYDFHPELKVKRARSKRVIDSLILEDATKSYREMNHRFRVKNFSSTSQFDGQNYTVQIYTYTNGRFGDIYRCRVKLTRNGIIVNASKSIKINICFWGIWL